METRLGEAANCVMMTWDSKSYMMTGANDAEISGNASWDVGDAAG